MTRLYTPFFLLSTAQSHTISTVFGTISVVAHLILIETFDIGWLENQSGGWLKQTGMQV